MTTPSAAPKNIGATAAKNPPGTHSRPNVHIMQGKSPNTSANSGSALAAPRYLVRITRNSSTVSGPLVHTMAFIWSPSSTEEFPIVNQGSSSPERDHSNQQMEWKGRLCLLTKHPNS